MSPDATDPARTGWPKWAKLLVMALIGGSIVFGSEYLQPWRTADVRHCVQRDDARGGYVNVCDVPVNFGFALLEGGSPEPQPFEFTTLQPREVEHSALAVSRAARNGQRFWYFACTVPHVPGVQTSVRNQYVTETACLRNTQTQR